MPPIAACRPIAAPPEVAYALLADLRTHWALADHWTEVRAIGAAGGTIRLRGPLGVRRTVRVRVRRRVPVRELEGIAELGPSTRADVSWSLEPDGAGGTLVTLSAQVLRAGLCDRLLLALGARRWLAWRFAVTLDRLDNAVRSDEEAHERVSAK